LIQVLRDNKDETRFYMTDNYPQNHYQPADRTGGDYYIYAVHELARAYHPAPIRRMLARFRIFIEDGRYFLNHAEERYDCIVLDAFLGDVAPSHLMTREALARLARVMAPDGVLIINTNVLHFGNDFFSTSLDKTLRSVYA
jgi:spermidine synthase